MTLGGVHADEGLGGERPSNDAPATRSAAPAVVGSLVQESGSLSSRLRLGRIARAFDNPVVYVAVDRLPAATSTAPRSAVSDAEAESIESQEPSDLELPSSLLTDPVVWRALGLRPSATERPLALLRRLLDRQRPLLAGHLEFALIGYDERAGLRARPQLAFAAGLDAEGFRAVRRFLAPRRRPEGGRDDVRTHRLAGGYRVWQLGAVRSSGFVEVALVDGVGGDPRTTELIVTNSSSATDRLLGVGPVAGTVAASLDGSASIGSSAFRSARSELFGAEPTPVGALWTYIDRQRLARAVRGHLASGLLARLDLGTNPVLAFDSLAIGVSPHESGLRSTVLIQRASLAGHRAGDASSLFETARIRDLVARAPAWALAPRVGAGLADGFVGGMTLAVGPRKLRTTRGASQPEQSDPRPSGSNATGSARLGAVRQLLETSCGQLGLSWNDAVGRLGRLAGFGWFAETPGAPLEAVHGIAVRSAPAARMLWAELGRAAERNGVGRVDGECLDLQLGASGSNPWAIAEHQSWLLIGSDGHTVRAALPHAKRRQRSARRAGLLSDLKRIGSSSQRVAAIVSVDSRGWAKGLGETSVLHARHSGYVAIDPSRLRLELLTQRPH